MFILLPIAGAPLAAVTALTGMFLLATSVVPVPPPPPYVPDPLFVFGVTRMLIGAGLLAVAF